MKKRSLIALRVIVGFIVFTILLMLFLTTFPIWVIAYIISGNNYPMLVLYETLKIIPDV